MHDTIKLERLGVCAVPVATHEFMTAARAQAAALGRPEFDAIYVPHPIQDQTKGEIEARADSVLAEIVARLCGTGLLACVVFVLALLGAVPMSAAELKIDHVTVAGRQLGQLQETLGSIGIPSENGGPHSNHATEMALVSFPDGSYLELIALQPNADPKAVAQHTWSKFLNGEAGPCAWAVQVPDVSAEARRLWKAGIKVTPPAKSGRTRPDGVRIDWDTARVGSGPNGSFFPFLIRDITPREIRAYPGGKPTTSLFHGIAKVVIGVKNLGESVEQYRRAYDLPAPKVQNDADFGAKLAWFEGTPVVFASPLTADSWLAKRIGQFGDAPCAFVLQGPATHDAKSNWFGRPVSWFDPAKLGWRLGVEPE